MCRNNIHLIFTVSSCCMYWIPKLILCHSRACLTSFVTSYVFSSCANRKFVKTRGPYLLGIPQEKYLLTCVIDTRTFSALSMKLSMCEQTFPFENSRLSSYFCTVAVGYTILIDLIKFPNTYLFPPMYCD